MSSGNHHSYQGQREINRRGECPSCGGILSEIDWCTEGNYECSKSCSRNIPMMPCYQAESKLKCRRCEIVFDVD